MRRRYALHIGIVGGVAFFLFPGEFFFTHCFVHPFLYRMRHLADFMRGADWVFFFFSTHSLAHSWGDLGVFLFSDPHFGSFLGRAHPSGKFQFQLLKGARVSPHADVHRGSLGQ
jgi:hypothetical protein